MSEKSKAQLTPRDWIATARRILIAEGVDQVKVQRLAAAMKVTRGGFYWHFRDRQHLLDELLALWVRTNTDAMVSQIGDRSRPLEERVIALFCVWLDPAGFDAGFDTAVRAWARKDRAVRQAVDAADERRTRVISEMFRDAGYPDPEAEHRALVMYFTQIGYYALGVEEPVSLRLERSASYYFIYTGRRLSAEGEATLRKRLSAAASDSRPKGKNPQSSLTGAKPRAK